jgi:hypothetical protein
VVFIGEFTELDSIIKVLFCFIYELVSEVYQRKPQSSIEVLPYNLKFIKRLFYFISTALKASGGSSLNLQELFCSIRFR